MTAASGESSASGGGWAIVTIVLAAATLAALAAMMIALVRGWRVEATMKVDTGESGIALGGGLELAGLSASGAAILGGPGVLALHLGARQVWQRRIAVVSVDALLAWLDARVTGGPAEAPRTAAGRAIEHAKRWLLARTDLADLPSLGVELLLDLRDVSIRGALLFGSSDPVIAGKAAAWLFPIAGIVAPFGTLDVRLDWSGKNRLDGAVDLAFRFVPARVVLEVLRFARRHVHLRPKSAAVSSTIPVSSTP